MRRPHSGPRSNTNRMRANARRMRAAKRDHDQALDHVRDSLASGAVELSPADDSPLPPEIVADAERQARITDCIEALEERERALVQLRMSSSLGWDEIAVRLGFPTTNAARMAHSRLLFHLKSALDRIDGMGDES